MLYVLALVFPPLAVLLCGKIAQAPLNLLLCLLGLVPGIIHAVLVVNQHHADKRNDRLIQAVRGQ